MLSGMIAAVISRPAEGDNEVVFDFVSLHCTACHDDTEASGDLNLKALQLQGASTFDKSREAWERVLSKLTTREMPPADEPRPPAEDMNRVTAWLSKEFLRQDRAIVPRAGRVTARRLNRAEYSNSIRDLLGVDIGDATDFPPDPAAFGFDNVSDALRMSPVLTEKYLQAAEQAVRKAIFGPKQLQPAMTHYPLPVRINLARGGRSLPDDLHNYDLSGLSTIHSAHVVHNFPVDAEYSFRIVLNGHRPDQSEPARPALFIDGQLVQEFEMDATDLEGQIVETRLRVAAGEHLLSATYLKNYHGLPPSYNGPEPSKRSPERLLSTTGELTEEDIEILRKRGTKIKTDGVEVRVDNRFESIDVGGPFKQHTSPTVETRAFVFECAHETTQHGPECARTVLSRFASRAFRRPATVKEIDQLVHLAKLVQNEGDTFEEGIATALQAVLVSPHFLFRIERDHRTTATEDAAPLSDHELASRLSYFIWSSTPDDELLLLAGNGSLHDPAVLENQVRRMLRDEKSRALVRNFAGQWLQFRNLEIATPDLRSFPQFEDSLRRSMMQETERFIEEIIRRDRSVLEILDADYTFVNERLARFYGLEGVEGPEYRKVNMSGTRRGCGILSHGSILTLTSYSTRTSPVLRGKWILETLLNDPPPPPPPSVPALDESTAGKSGSLRQELEAHRENIACASCHSRMDPLGFSLENFDGIGAWRGKDSDEDIDVSGVLPSGRTFDGHQGLKQILLDDRDTFAKGLTEKLLIYALGRGLERYDRPTVLEITGRLKSADYRFSELVLGIVDSLPFRMQNSDEQHPARDSNGENLP